MLQQAENVQSFIMAQIKSIDAILSLQKCLVNQQKIG